MRGRLVAWALARPHVLLVPAPRSRELRRRVEAELDRRRWPLALSPAEADVLLQVGAPGPDLAAAADVLWDQVPQPRLRRTVGDGDDVRGLLDALALDLPRAAARPEDAGPGSGPAASPAAGSPDGSQGQGHGGSQGEQDHDEHGDGDEGHHHHDGDVAGLPMAGTEADRDGLELDALTVDLGPVLPGWPAGLTVRGRLQGDVLTGVEVRTCEERSALVVDPFAVDQTMALDALADILLVAGWATAARDARQARAAVVDRQPGADRRVRRLTGAVRTSRSLRWSVRGLGVASSTAPWPESLRGDVWDRVLHWCAAAERAERATASALSPVGPDVWVRPLEGAELAAARLTVASLAPGLDAGRENADRAAVTTRG